MRTIATSAAIGPSRPSSRGGSIGGWLRISIGRASGESRRRSRVRGSRSARRRADRRRPRARARVARSRPRPGRRRRAVDAVCPGAGASPGDVDERHAPLEDAAVLGARDDLLPGIAALLEAHAAHQLEVRHLRDERFLGRGGDRGMPGADRGPVPRVGAGALAFRPAVEALARRRARGSRSARRRARRRSRRPARARRIGSGGARSARAT
jgi:hypothetical protein